MSTHLVPIFKTGTHTARDGRTLTFTTSDLDRFATIYNTQPPNSRHDATACIGHKKDDAPAYGWFDTIKRNGEILYGEMRDPHPDFVQWVKDRRYWKRSAKFDENGLLKHVAWLGAQAPAIKGLPDFSFSEEGEGPEYEVEFSEDEINDIDTTTSTSSEADMDPATQATQQTPPATDTTTVTAQAANGQVVASVPATEFAEYQERTNAELAKLRDQNQTLEFSEFLNKRITKVTPAMRPLVMRIMKEAANSGRTYEFAEGDLTVSAALIDDIKKLIDQLPDSTSLEEAATEGQGGEGEAEFAEGSDAAAEIARLTAKATGRTTLNGGVQ